jgi:hypothetical protein
MNPCLASNTSPIIWQKILKSLLIKKTRICQAFLKFVDDVPSESPNCNIRYVENGFMILLPWGDGAKHVVDEYEGKRAEKLMVN